jgi:TonB family protein
MSQQLQFKPHKSRHNPKAIRRVGSAFHQGGGALAADFPGLILREPESSRRTWLTGGAATLLHLGVIGGLVLLASLAPPLVEEMIPVQLIKETPPAPEEPAPAPRALAERRLPNFAPQVQTVAPQIVNPRVIADASPAVEAQALQMDAVSSVVAPRQISRSSAPVVERVSVVNSPIAARASAVDVQGVSAPAVRGPVRVDAPVGASVGPRKVDVASTGRSIGTGKLQIGGEGSSVREGVISNRDVVGSPTGAPLVSIDTAVGDGLLRGSGGSGDSIRPGGASGPAGAAECTERSEVRNYLAEVERRTYDRWVLPPGIDPDQQVVLRFALDAAGSAVAVSVAKSSDNALGASAVDALRAAAPFPPMSGEVRCLAGISIRATFTNQKKS